MKYDILVNKENPLSKEYIPENLVYTKSKIKPFFGDEEDHMLVPEVLINFNNLKEKASSNGYEIEISSGYRSYQSQEDILKHYLKIDGDQAYAYIALPGQSEHQTGLALDFLPYRKQLRKDMTEEELENFEILKKEIYHWVSEHAHLFGFIIRYPIAIDNSEFTPHHITGYIHEPWHLRFVGIDRAKYMKEHNLTLEEYKEKQLIG